MSTNPNTSRSRVFTPVVDADTLYGDGDWRPILGAAPRAAGWKTYIIGKQSIEHKLKGYIMPSFDWSLALDDKAFQSGVAPCWSNDTDKRASRHFVPTPFALPLLMYPFMGESKEHWMSPHNLKSMIGREDVDPADAADAFHDLGKAVRMNKSYTDAKKDFFLKGATFKDAPLIPTRSLRYFLLTVCHDKESEEHYAACGVTQSAYSYIIEQMRWIQMSGGAPARDPNWPQYMLGDVTDPTAALEWHVDKVQLDKKDPQETNVICFTEREECLDKEPHTRVLSAADLAARFLLPDPANWNIPTYEEQVDYMLKSFDAAVPYDLMRDACAANYRGNFPSARPESVRVSASKKSDEPEQESRTRGGRREDPPSRGRQAEEEDPIAAVTRGSRFAPTAPPAPVAPTVPVAAAPAAANDSTLYWAGEPDTEPTERTVAQLQALFDAGQGDQLKVMVKDGVWLTLRESGLVVLPKVVPTVPRSSGPPVVPSSVPKVPPSVPSVSAPAPTATAQPEGDGAITEEQMHLQMFPDQAAFSALSTEQQARGRALSKRAWEATDGGRKSDLPADVVDGILELLG